MRSALATSRSMCVQAHVVPAAHMGATSEDDTEIDHENWET